MSSPAYTPPVITTAGMSIPTYLAIYNYLVQSLQTIYGAGVVTDNSSSDIQLLSIFALALADACSALQQEYNNRALNFAIGAALDSIGSLVGITRKKATPSTVTVTLSGQPGALILNGVVIDSSTGNRWDLPASVLIGLSGTVNAIATCEASGAISIGAGTVTGIATPTAGWTSVTNASASTPGLPIESDSQFRTRLGLSVAGPSQTILAGTFEAISAVTGVTRVQIDENVTSTTNGNSTPGHSIQAVVEGGADADIAQAIFIKRSLGSGTFGSHSVTITDPNDNVATTISFQRPTYDTIWVIINAHNQAGGSITSQQISAIQNAIANYLNGLQLGAVISFGELAYAAAAAVNSNPEIPAVSIRSPLFFGTSASPSTSADIVLAFGHAAQCVAAVNVTVNNV